MPGQPSNRPVERGDLPPDQRIWLRNFRTWQRFHHGPRQEPGPLTKTLASYPDAVLVAGCQRSGTTMLTRVIARSRAFRGLALTHDDELDAAITLAGYLELPRDKRYCFQTTYLNERYPEYRAMGAGQKLIWVLRNPASVVYSMVYNWKRFALNELYEATREAALKRADHRSAPCVGAAAAVSQPEGRVGLCRQVRSDPRDLAVDRTGPPARARLR